MGHQVDLARWKRQRGSKIKFSNFINQIRTVFLIFFLWGVKSVSKIKDCFKVIIVLLDNLIILTIKIVVGSKKFGQNWAHNS